MKERSSTVDITLLVCTFNRAADLRELLESAVLQETGGLFCYDILIVDNNSSDHTRRVVEEFLGAGHTQVRYVFEGRQGRSNALNTGLNALQCAMYALADDDLILPRDYLIKLFKAFAAHPEVSFIGGKILPAWQSDDVPMWLTQRHWAPLALVDYGSREIYSDDNNPIALLAGAFRVSDVRALGGGYHPELGVTERTMGGTEDVELQTRLWDTKKRGLYVPELWLYHKVEPQRVTRQYHRQWHTGHGRYHSVMRNARFERSSARLFDVPAHLYRQTAVSCVHWLRDTLSGNGDAAFLHETRIRFFLGFFDERYKQFRSRSEQSAYKRVSSTLGEVARFVWSFVVGKRVRSLNELSRKLDSANGVQND